MSHDERDDFESSLEDLRNEVAALTAGVARVTASATTFERVAPWVKLLVLGAFAFGVWLTTIEIRQQSATSTFEDVATKDETHDRALAALEIWKASATNQADTVAASTRAVNESVADIKDSLVSLDKRQTRTEDALEGIKDMLDRIERRLPGEPSAAR